MPNLWTKTIQSFNEKFSGPRTNDLEIKKKYEEALMMDKALKNLKNVILNFTHRFEEIMNYNRQISESIIILYDNNEEYKEFGQVLNQVHLENNKLFKQITIEIYELNEKTKDWPSYFSKVKDLYEEKEEIRKTYDHYEKKMEELILDKEGKVKRGLHLNESFLRKLERAAKEKYLSKCIDAYDTYENLLNDRFNLINQPLLNLFYIEMQLYENFSSKYKKYRDLENKLIDMRKNFAQKDRKMKYDPTMFMKNPYLESKFNINKEEMTEGIRKLKEEHMNYNNNNFNYIHEERKDSIREKQKKRKNSVYKENRIISTEEKQKKTKISLHKENKIKRDTSNDINEDPSSFCNNINKIKNFPSDDEYRIHQQNEANSFFNSDFDEFKLDNKRQNQTEIRHKHSNNNNNNIIDISCNQISSSDSSSVSSENDKSLKDNLNLLIDENNINSNKGGNNIILLEEMNNDNDAAQLDIFNENANLINLQADYSENTNNEINTDKSKISYPSLKSVLDQYNIEVRNSYSNRNEYQQNIFAEAKREEVTKCIVPFDYFDDKPEDNAEKKITQIKKQNRPIDDLFKEDQLFYNREIVSKVSNTAKNDPFADFY